MNKKNLLEEARQRKIHIEGFPTLTVKIISNILNKMSDEELYYWVEIESKQTLISKTIRQFSDADKLTQVLKGTEWKMMDSDFYYEELLKKMIEIDRNEGLVREVDIIL